MKLKRKIKPGVCAANRCTATGGLADRDGVQLCPRHFGEPIEDSAPTKGGSGSELVPVQVKAEVAAPIEAEALALRAKLTEGAIAVRTPDDIAAGNPGITMEQAGALAAHLQGRITATEGARKRVTAHLVAAKREMDAWFKPSVDAFKAAKQVIHDAMTAFATEQNRARMAALQAGDHSAAMAAAPVALPAGTHERKRVLWRVTDSAAVPREFLAVDAARVQRVVDAQGLQTSIPGIEAYEETKLVTRGA